jgi:hypothetical protein
MAWLVMPVTVAGQCVDGVSGGGCREVGSSSWSGLVNWPRGVADFSPVFLIAGLTLVIAGLVQLMRRRPLPGPVPGES